MKRFPRFPLAAATLVAGAIGGMTLSAHLHGQAPPAAHATQPLPAVTPKLFESYRDVVKRIVPAVVSIEARTAVKPGTDQPRRPAPQLPPGVPEEFRRFFEGMEESRPRQLPQVGFGSGVVVDPAGVILTNNHVVAGADTVEVEFQDGRKFTSTDIRHDPKTDLAVVRIKGDGPFPHLEFGDSDAMQVGDQVLAVGAPFGLAGSVTQGIISAKSRNNLRLAQYEDFIQTDAAINPGNSGGPLVNLEGKVIGINSAIRTRSGGFQGVGLAISGNLAKDISHQLLTNGSVKRGYLGVGIKELDDEVAARLGVTDGALVTKVYDGSPAAKAGLAAGDVITAVGGQQVADPGLLPRAVFKTPIGQPLDLTYVRDGKPVTKAVTVEEQPADYGTERAADSIAPRRARSAESIEVAGLSVADLTPELATQLGYGKDAKGAIVLGVDRNSPAADKGFARGLLVVKVDKTPVNSAEEFRKALAGASKEKGALVQVTRPTGESDFVVLKPE
jgi:serine protease Do